MLSENKPKHFGDVLGQIEKEQIPHIEKDKPPKFPLDTLVDWPYPSRNKLFLWRSWWLNSDRTVLTWDFLKFCEKNKMDPSLGNFADWLLKKIFAVVKE